MGLNLYGILLLEPCQPVQADIAPGSYVVIPNGDGDCLGLAGHDVPPVVLRPDLWRQYSMRLWSFD